jgi:hypothetical protein
MRRADVTAFVPSLFKMEEHMGTKAKWGIVGLGLVPMFAFGLCTGRAYAQGGQPDPGTERVTIETAQSTSALTLKRTKITTLDNGLSLSTTPVLAFSQVTGRCPATAVTCTIGVEISSQFFNLSGSNVAQIIIAIDGSGLGINPSSVVNVNTNTGTLATTSTFTFMKTGLSPGPHTVDVSFDTNAGTGTAGFRTLTVQVFTP